jgi:hypothetical protein
MNMSIHYTNTVNFMEQKPLWEANGYSASQEIPRPSWKQKAHYRVHNSPIPKAILSQLNSVQKLMCEPGISQSVWRRAGRQGLDSRQGQEVFLCSTVSRLALVPTQPPIKWVPWTWPPHKAFLFASERKSNIGSKTNLMGPNVTYLTHIRINKTAYFMLVKGILWWIEATCTVRLKDM